MPVFDIISGEPVINPEALFIPGFKEVWASDKSEGKVDATQKILYVYHLCNPRSAYSLMSPEERLRETKKDFLDPYKIKPDANLQKAIEKYSGPLLRDAGYRFLEGLEVAIDHITKILKDEKTYGEASKIKFTELTAVIEKGSNILTSYYKLRKQVEEGLQEDMTFRGGGQPSMVEEFSQG